MRRDAPDAADRQPGAIELHIDELVLEGFDARDRRAIADVLQRELGRLLAERGGPWTPSAAERIDAGAVAVARGVAARDVGAAVAAALLRALPGAEA
jgi:hypothetical protein